ncbi:MAG: hypothetical protein PHY99_03800, partial [Bacteroidales bacterium]|nr:hypothetical protein [Bacteroidales bacterium]
MTRILGLTMSFFLFFTTLESQEKVKLFYNSGWKVTAENKASYYRESEYDLNSLKLQGKVLDYTLSGNLLMEGNYLNGKRNGNFIFYFDKGKIRSQGAYENNQRVGEWRYYYHSGQLRQIVLFKNIDNSNDIAVVEFYDKVGNQLIKNGTGKWVNDSIQTGLFDFASIKTLTGQFKDSLKQGEWQLIRNSDKKLMHSERFKKGKFIGARLYNDQLNYYGTISSEMLDKIPDENIAKLRCTENFELDSTVYPKDLLTSDTETIFKSVTGKEFQVQNRQAGYRYGDDQLLEFLSNNIRYPIGAID